MSLHSNVYEDIAALVALVAAKHVWTQEQKDLVLGWANDSEEEVFGWVEWWEDSEEEAQVVRLVLGYLEQHTPPLPGQAELVADLQALLGEEEAQAAEEWSVQSAVTAAPEVAADVADKVGNTAGVVAAVVAGAALLWALR